MTVNCKTNDPIQHDVMGSLAQENLSARCSVAWRFVEIHGRRKAQLV